MLKLAAFLIGVSLALTHQAKSAESWATVPASAYARQLGLVSVPSFPTEAIVTLLHRNGAATFTASTPLKVFSVDIPLRTPAQGAVQMRSGVATPVIPEGALWPGADGRITQTVSDAGPAAAKRTIRNPWAIRIHPKAAMPDAMFVCGGIIVGGDSTPTALINGRIERRGDKVGGFVVDTVAIAAVVLSRNGVQYVLPLGRSTAIACEEP